MSSQAEKDPFITQWELDQALAVFLVIPVFASMLGGVAAAIYLPFLALVALSVGLVFIAYTSARKMRVLRRWRGSFARTALASSAAWVIFMWWSYAYHVVS
ncbi:MAG: hypothetical protein HY457_03440 [Parcubacteria group bacterium]|nr:hypothetical protein [Parcubacteria group bacterium]